jgi:hypothetical protein
MNDKCINGLSSYRDVAAQAGHQSPDVAPNDADKLTGKVFGKRVPESTKRWSSGKA